MKGPKPSHVRRTVVLAGAQKYKSVPPAHKNSQQFAGYRRATVKYGKFLEYKRILWNYAFMNVRLR